MFKRGPTATPDTARNSADSPQATTPAKQGASLLKSMLPGIAGPAVMMMIIALTATQVFLPSLDEDLRIDAAQTELSQAHTVTRLAVDHFATAVETVARDPRLVQAVTLGDRALLAQNEALALHMLPAPARVALFPLGKALRETDGTPAISFAQIEMIRNVESGRPSLPEVHKSAKGAFLSIVKPVTSGEKVIGTLYAAFEFSAVSQRLGPLPPRIGYLEWEQQFGSLPPYVIVQRGDSALSEGEPLKISLKEAHWVIKAWPLAEAENASTLANKLWLACLLGALACVGLGLAAMHLCTRTVERDADQLAHNVRGLMNREKARGGYSLSALRAAADTIEEAFSAYDANLRQQLLALRNIPARGGPATKPAPAARAAEPDPLDIDLDDADADLLGGASLSDNEFLMGSPARPAASPMAGAASRHSPLDAGLDDLDLEDIDLSGSATPPPAPAAPIRAPIRQTATSSLSDEIFRAYDIRGVVGSNLTPEIARLIGLAIGSLAMEQAQDGVIVARDGRLSSEELQKALVDGLVESGQRVYDIGMVPTPVLYYATHILSTQSGVMVTGSHNPPEYNGFKIVIEGNALHGADIQALKKRIREADFTRAQGSYERHDILKSYKDRITHDVVLARPMRVVVDSGNGVGGVVFPSIIDRLGCNVTSLFEEVDGRFPNHHPDPSVPSNLATLIETVRAKNADLGLAIDGDGDRLGVVTRSGKIILPDRLLMLFARDLLSRNPGADILYDVKCTRDVVDLVSHLGGRAILSATGHSIMKAKMKETGAVVGGELSGHLFFNDRWYGFDDAIYAAARLLEILSMEAGDADQVFDEFPTRANTPEIRIPVSEARKFDIVTRLSDQGNFSGGNLVKVDGVRVDYPHGWGLLRASNTTPHLIARFEGDDESALEDIMERFQAQLQRVEPGLSIPL
jgi:phosphomannomutase/phosphoglucomutase